MVADETEVADMCCASCGIAEVDDIKMTKCDDCDLVRYCSDKCQQDHQSQHEAMCKERSAELRDEILFRQPESTHMGDCPICLLPLPIHTFKSSLYICCTKMICRGCEYANMLRETEASMQQTCPFCRHPLPKTQKESEMNKMKRVAANDRVAIHQEGVKHHQSGDFESAFEYYTKAAELGDAMAHYDLSVLYQYGEHVEKDEKKEMYHLEEAAIRGHPHGRFRLGCYALHANKSYDRAVKHWIIAANLGHDDSIQSLKKCYTHGVVSKEDFAAALRAHQASVDATKSLQREAATEAIVRDEILFRQPESSHLGNCPICLLPLSLTLMKSRVQSCCMKIICKGCSQAHRMRQRNERLERTCPLCATKSTQGEENIHMNKMKRAEANDPFAVMEIGRELYRKGCYDSAFEYLSKAAVLGDAMAHYHLSLMYRKGEGVEKDMGKELYHLEEAAIAGHPDARYNLAGYEDRNGSIERAVKHYIIAANLGHDESIQMLKKCYVDGKAGKDDFAAALRGHQAAVDATKSPQREEAANVDLAKQYSKLRN